MRDVVAAGAHVRRAPRGEGHPPRPLPVLLAMALDEEPRRLPAEPPGRRGGDGAGVDGVEVPPRRQHVGAPAGGGAGRSGLEEASVEGGEHPPDLRLRARVEGRADPLVRLREHRTGLGPRLRARETSADERPGKRFQAFDGVAGRAPRRRRPVPAVGERVRERAGPLADPARPEVAVEGVEPVDTPVEAPVETKVAGEGAGDGSARTRVLAAGHAHERDEEVEEALRIRAPAEHVQAVPDLHLLELAEIGVELGERLARFLAGGDAAVPVEPDARDELEDLVSEDREAPRVHPRRLVVLVDEALEVGKGTVGLRPGEGRGQVVDNDRLRAALGLRPLPRVVDDERVDVRERAERRLRVARGGEGEGFAGKPFEVPVLAHVHDRVDPRPLPEPGVEGEVAVGGYEVGVVIGGGGVDVVAPRGLKPDDDVAEADRWYGESRTLHRELRAGAGTIFRTRAPDRTGTRTQTRARIDSRARAPITGRICPPGRSRARAESRALHRARALPGDGASLGIRTSIAARTCVFSGVRTSVFVTAFPRLGVRARGVAVALRRPGQEIGVTLGRPPSLAQRLRAPPREA